ncbi:hypothetical protein ACLOJK_014512 [Asimina triloba]
MNEWWLSEASVPLPFTSAIVGASATTPVIKTSIRGGHCSYGLGSFQVDSVSSQPKAASGTAPLADITRPKPIYGAADATELVAENRVTLLIIDILAEHGTTTVASVTGLITKLVDEATIVPKAVAKARFDAGVLFRGDIRGVKGRSEMGIGPKVGAPKGDCLEEVVEVEEERGDELPLEHQPCTTFAMQDAVKNLGMLIGSSSLRRVITSAENPWEAMREPSS